MNNRAVRRYVWGLLWLIPVVSNAIGVIVGETSSNHSLVIYCAAVIGCSAIMAAMCLMSAIVEAGSPDG